MRKSIRFFWVSLMLAAFVASSALAQGLSVSGTIISADNGDPLPGAEVQVKGTFTGTTTDAKGKFSLLIPDQSSATLVVNYIGYKEKEVDVSSNTSSLSIELEEQIIRGSEVVVTGLATSVKRRNLANSVGTISEEELVPAPAQTLERALNGKIAGMSISQNTGAPGGGISVNLRGVSTITGSTQPLYVIDGVIIDNSAIQSGIDAISEATGVGSNRPQGQPTNRIADINPNDIASIEVLKGPSAAAIYGAKASNGVVIISTKQGTPGETKIDVSQQSGFVSILNKLGNRQYDAAKAEALIPADPESGEIGGAARFNQVGQIDYEDLVYGQRGYTNETSLSIRGGNSKTKFYIGGLVLDEGGIVENTGYQKLSGKVNINHKLNDRMDLSVFTQLARTESDRSITGNENASSTTLGFALAFTPPFIDLRPDANGVYPGGPAGSNPLETIQLLTNNERVYRNIGSFRFNWNLLRSKTQTLDFITIGGVDFFSLEHNVISPPELQFERNKAPSERGETVVGETESTKSNVYFNLAHSYRTSNSTIFTTSAGFQFENANVNNVIANSLGTTPTQTNVDLASSVSVFQTRTIQRERGFFLQEEVDFNEKIFLTAGVRGDASSANGDTDKFYLFPKFSGSVRLSEYGFLSSLTDEFKLRAAYGETGNLPAPFFKYTSLDQANVVGLSGVEPQRRKGLADIKPERTKEIEFGFDASIFNGRGSLEASYYVQNISDLILINSLPASSGYSQEVIQGDNEMRTNGFEISLGLHPLKGDKLNWNTRFNFYKTTSEITSLSVDPFETGGFRLSLGQVQVKEGQSPTTIVGLDESGNVAIFGNETPDFQLAMNNQLQFGNFDLSFLWDWQQGGEVINLGLFLTDIGGNSEDYDTPEGEARRAGTGGTGRFVEDATYFKLREFALSYTFGKDFVDGISGGSLSYIRAGLAGRNLLMFTDYKGYDPEVGQFGNLPIGRSMDTIPFPSTRQIYFNLSFGM